MAPRARRYKTVKPISTMAAELDDHCQVAEKPVNLRAVEMPPARGVRVVEVPEIRRAATRPRARD